MTPEDAKFIIEKDAAMAVSLAQLSLRHDNPMWKTLMKEGLLKSIRTATGARRDLMDSLIRCKKTDNAVYMLKAILDDMKPKQREALFCNVRKNSVIVLDWIDFSRNYTVENGTYSIPPDAKKHLTSLIKTVQSYGLEVNVEFKATGNRSRVYESSVMRESLAQSVHRNWTVQSAMAPVEFLFEMGAKVDMATKAMVLEREDKIYPLEVVRWFDERGYAKPQDWLQAKDHRYANAQSVALLQSMMAKTAIDEMVVQEKAKKVLQK